MSPSEHSLVSSVVKGIQWIGFGIVLQATMRIGVLAIMARLVSPRDFGLFAIALIFTSFAERLGQVGVGAAFVQRSAIDKDDLKTALVLSLISGFVITGGLCAVAPLGVSLFGEAALGLILAVMAVGFMVDSFGVVSDGLLQRELKFRSIVAIEVTSFVIGNALIGITLGTLGFGVWALVFGNLTMRVCKAAFLVWSRPPSLAGRWSRQRAGALLSTGLGFSLGKILNFLSLQGDNFIVGRVLGAEALGMYTRAYQAMTLPAMYVGQAFERVLFPAMSQRQENITALRRGLLSTLEVSAMVALPVSVGMFLLSEEIVIVLFGPVWKPIVPVLTILSWGVFFRAAYKCSDVLIRSTGDVYAYAARQAWYTGIIVGGSLCGAMINGLQGVAYAVVLGVSVNYLLMTRLAGRIAQVTARELVQCHLPGVWISGGVWMAMMIVLPILREVNPPPVVILATSSLVGTAAAFGAWYLGGARTRGEYAYPVLKGLVTRRCAH